MPGLVGCVSLDGNRIDQHLMMAMEDAIKHRGWYKVDGYVNPRGTVAISRVNLNVINKEEQPYLARGGRVKVFLHGELHSDEAARTNPLELIYRLYEKQGLDFAASLNGSFVTAVIDEDEGIVLVANDRIASKPLFLFNDGRVVYFGPEMKSLFLVPSLQRKLNLAGVADFLANGHFTVGHSLIHNIKWVDSATVLKITRNGVSNHKYWKWELVPDDGEKGPDSYREELVELLRQAFRRSLRAEGTYGVLLSGGLDSRGVLGFYLGEKGDQKLQTISWGQDEDTPHSDCAVAKRIAQRLGANHRFYHLTAEEAINGFYDFVLLGEGLTWNLWPFDVFHRIREEQGIDIILRGDQWFGNGDASLVHDEPTMLITLGLRRLRNIAGYQRILAPHYYQLFSQLNDEIMYELLSRWTTKNLHIKRDCLYLDVRMKYYLNPLDYVKTYAVESFRPLLDSDVLDFVSTLPIQYRRGKSFWRETVAKTFPHLDEETAQIRNDIDWRASLRGSPGLKRFVYRKLIEEENRFDEFIDKDGLKRELDAFFAPHQGGSRETALRKGVAQRFRKASPGLFHRAHRSFYFINKWLGKSVHTLPTDRMIIQLLILKAWGDVFLDYPVVRVAD